MTLDPKLKSRLARYVPEPESRYVRTPAGVEGWAPIYVIWHDEWVFTNYASTALYATEEDANFIAFWSAVKRICQHADPMLPTA